MHTISKIIIAFILGIIFTIPAYSQLDYYAGQNRSGFRLGIGGGAAILQTHYSKNPVKGVFVGNLDYDFNPYLSIGIEGKYGSLQGIDEKNYLFYKQSDIKFYDANVNIKASVGEFFDYQTSGILSDAIKRFYIGAGVGIFDETSITLTYNPNHPSDATSSYGEYKAPPYLAVPFNFGTNIDLRGIIGGSDKWELNPNYQFTYVNSYYMDGFRKSSFSTLKGFYNVLTLSLKYKF